MALNRKIFPAENDEDILVVKPQGDSTSIRYQDLHLEANAALRDLSDPSIKHVIVDLAEVKFVSSIVIGALVRMTRQTTNQGGKARFCNGNNATKSAIETMGLFKLWPYCETREIALQEIRETE
jgi:anti-sigma B factor antagonist